MVCVRVCMIMICNVAETWKKKPFFYVEEEEAVCTYDKTV